MAKGELASLFERFRAHGDVAALSAVFGRTAPELLALARHLAPDEGAAEDLVQATFVAAIEHAERFDAERELAPWLVGILTNKAKLAQALRARVPDAERLVEREPIDPALDAELREFVRALDRALERVPRRYRDVLRGHLSEGKRPEQIADELGRAPGTVRVQLHRGLAHLRRALPPGFALGVVVTSARARGLPAIRADVLRHAHFAASAAGVSTSLLLGGWIVSTKLVAAAALVLLAAAGLWFFTRGESSHAELGRVALAPAPVEPAQIASSAASPPELDVARREPVPEVAGETSTSPDDPYGALDIEVVWSDGTPAADLEIECTAMGEMQPVQLAVPRVTDARGKARVERIREGDLAIAVPALRHDEYPIQVRRGIVNAIRVELPPGRDVHGRVFDVDGRGVSDAIVWAKHGPSPMINPAVPAARTSGDGSFVLRSALRPRDVDSSRQGKPASAWLHLSATATGLGSSPDVGATWDDAGNPQPVELRLRGESAELEGRVLSPDGEPVENARVSLYCRNTSTNDHHVVHWPWVLLRTGPQGSFRAAGLHRGRVSILVGARLHPVWHETIELESGGTRTIEVRLEQGTSVSGSIRDKHGNALSNAYVTYEPPAEQALEEDAWPLFARGDEHGRYRLEGVPAGKATLAAAFDDDDRQRRLVRDFDLEPGAQLAWDVVFDDGLTIVGRAQDPTGRALVGWHVQAIQVPNVDRIVPEGVLTDGEGRFELTNLRDVPHWVLLSQTANDGNDWLAKVENVRPGDPPITLVGDPADLPSAYLRGFVVDAAGQPIAGADLWAHLRARNNSRDATTNAGDGSFRIGPLWRGDYTVSVSVEGLPSVDLDVAALAASEERDIGAITIAETGTAEIVLTTRDGKPLSRPSVWLRDLREQHDRLSSEDEVTFRSHALFPGTYRLIVVAANAATEIHEIEIRAHETARARFELAPGAMRLVFLRPVKGDPVLGPAQITVRNASDEVVLEDRRTFIAGTPGDNASVFFASFPYGPHHIEVAADDGRRASLEFDVAAGELPPPLELQFPARR